MRTQGTAKALALPAADRAAVRAHANAAQWDEWDDEYDDSFDDLGVVNLDGAADVEGALALLHSLHSSWPCIVHSTAHTRS